MLLQVHTDLLQTGLKFTKRGFRRDSSGMTCQRPRKRCDCLNCGFFRRRVSAVDGLPQSTFARAGRL